MCGTVRVSEGVKVRMEIITSNTSSCHLEDIYLFNKEEDLVPHQKLPASRARGGRNATWVIQVATRDFSTVVLTFRKEEVYLAEVEVYAFGESDGDSDDDLLWWESFQQVESGLHYLQIEYSERGSGSGSDRLQAHRATDAEGDESPTFQLEVDQYSSFHCMYGSQRFPWQSPHEDESLNSSWKVTIERMYNFPREEHEISRERICIYKNMCYIDGQYYFYENENAPKPPEYMKFSSNPGMNHAQSQSYLVFELTGKNITMPFMKRYGPIPRELFNRPQLKFSPEPVIFLQGQSQTHNFAHCILEDILPVMMAMDVLDLGPLTNAKILHICDDRRGTAGQIKQCQHNFNLFTTVLGLNGNLHGEFYQNNEAQGFGNDYCMPKLVMGHNMAFSGWFLDKHVTPYLQQIREKFLLQFGFTKLKKPTSHLILVLSKGSFGFNTTFTSTSDWPNLCSEVTTLVQQGNWTAKNIPVKCIMVTDNVKEISYWMHRSTVVVSEHGTLAHTSLFLGRKGLVHIVGCSKYTCKMRHERSAMHVKYLFIFKGEDLLPTMRFALDTTAITFHIHNSQ